MMEDAFAAPETDAAETENETPDSIDEQEAENPTALLPLSALGKNVKAGDTVTLKVVKLYDDEAEVELSSETETESPAEDASAGEELDSMDTEKD